MKLFEYQAKEIFRSYEILTPTYQLIDTPEEIEVATEHCGFPCVIKAQVLHGGRGKAGLVKSVKTKEQAQEEAQRIYGLTQNRLLVEAMAPIKQELYISFTTDAATGRHLLMISAEGGVDIETLVQQSPEKIFKIEVDPFIGFQPHDANDIVFQLGLEDVIASKALVKTLLKLYRVFRNEEATLVEVNPMVITEDAQIMALDGKVVLDDSASFRHTTYPLTRAHFDHDVEFEASQEGIPYLQFDGDIGMLVAGAGLANVVFDLIHYHGGSVYNYLEFGGPNYHKSKKCMEMMMSTNPKCILIVTFGTIARADVMAEGIVAAVRERNPAMPIVCSIKGTGEEAAEAMLQEMGLPLITDTEEAVALAVKRSKEVAK